MKVQQDLHQIIQAQGFQAVASLLVHLIHVRLLQIITTHTVPVQLTTAAAAIHPDPILHPHLFLLQEAAAAVLIHTVAAEVQAVTAVAAAIADIMGAVIAEVTVVEVHQVEAAAVQVAVVATGRVLLHPEDAN